MKSKEWYGVRSKVLRWAERLEVLLHVVHGTEAYRDIRLFIMAIIIVARDNKL